MVQIMSFDIKFHQISIDSKQMLCFDFIASFSSISPALRKYADNSGDNENIPCVSKK